MSKIILEGGTDVAEMALFATDEIPQAKSDDELIEKMEKENHLVRFPTGADGGYLLHLYINDQIDKDIYKHCVHEDTIKGKLSVESGNISFGGLESVVKDFKPNKNIRSDCEIKSGLFEFSAFHTDYPDEFIEDKIIQKIGEENLKYVNFPGTIIGLGVILSIVFTILAINVDMLYSAAVLATIIGAKIWFSKFTNSNKYKELEKKQSEVEYQFPSIVVKLKSINRT